jgi:hypothetical protein
LQARRTLAVAIVLTLTVGTALAAPAAGHSGDAKPRFIRHIERYPGGISGGVRAMVSDEVVAARAALRTRATSAPRVPGGPTSR